MKHALAAPACVALLVTSLAACGGTSDKSALPTDTGGSTPSTTAGSRPTSTPPTPTATKFGPAPLAAHTTYTYGGLKVVVNLPAEIPARSRPSMRLFYDFLQAAGRTTSRNKLDPSLSGLASADVVKYIRTTTGGESVQGIGSMISTISTVRTAGTSGFAMITGCVDQSNLVQVRKDGSQFVDAGGKKNPTLKLTANINRRGARPEVTLFEFAVGSC